MFNWVNPKTELRRSRIHSSGLYATEPIERDEMVAIWGGYIKPFSEVASYFSNGVETPVEISAITVEDGFVITSMKESELDKGDRINHSCDPNCGIRGQITLVAMRRIGAVEEITFDYAMVDSFPKYRFQCSCGSRLCRKVVTNDDWKRKDLQMRYGNYFSNYLKEKMK